MASERFGRRFSPLAARWKRTVLRCVGREIDGGDGERRSCLSFVGAASAFHSADDAPRLCIRRLRRRPAIPDQRSGPRRLADADHCGAELDGGINAMSLGYEFGSYRLGPEGRVGWRLL